MDENHEYFKLTEYHRTLLKTLKDSGKKYVDFGRSPVSAIEAAFKLSELGYVNWNGDYIDISNKGLEELKDV